MAGHDAEMSDFPVDLVYGNEEGIKCSFSKKNK